MGQSSYSFSVDSISAFWHPYLSHGISPCVDGGYLLSETFYGNISSEFRLIKFSADGSTEWTRTSNFGTNFVDLHSIRSVAMTDSGFIVSVYVYDFMFAQFITTYTMRLNKFGDIVYGKRGVGFPQVTLAVTEVDTVDDIPLFVYGIAQYDPIEDEPCCYQGFFGRLSPLLQPMGLKYQLLDQNNISDNIYLPRYLNENGIATDILISTVDNTRPLVTRLDLSYNIIWRKGYDQFLMQDMAQLGESIYMIGGRQQGAVQQDAVLHKIDINGNTIFDKLLSSPSFPNLKINHITSKNDSTLLISAFTNPISLYAALILLEMDTSGNVIQAFCGTDTLVIKFTTSIDDRTGNTYSCHMNSKLIEKLNIDSLECNYQPISITITDFLTIDSSFTATVSGSAFTLVNDSLPTYQSSVTTIPICGFLTGVAEINLAPSFQLFPNPVINQVIITGTDKISEIAILSMAGTTIFDQKIDSDRVSVDVSQWSAGIYIVRIISGDHVTTMKLLKTD